MHAPQDNPLFCSVDGWRRDLIWLDETTSAWHCSYCGETSAPIYEGERP